MESIREAFATQHRELDELFDSARSAAEEGAWFPAQDRFLLFRNGIEKHMGVEERLLFPAYEEHHGGMGTETAGDLRKDHRDLRIFFDKIWEALLARDPEHSLDLMNSVHLILRQHESREESELYPAMDALMAEYRDVVLAVLRHQAA